MSGYATAVLTNSCISGLFITGLLYQYFASSLILSLTVDTLAPFLIVSLLVPLRNFNANRKNCPLYPFINKRP